MQEENHYPETFKKKYFIFYGSPKLLSAIFALLYEVPYA